MGLHVIFSILYLPIFEYEIKKKEIAYIAVKGKHSKRISVASHVRVNQFYSRKRPTIWLEYNRTRVPCFYQYRLFVYRPSVLKFAVVSWTVSRTFSI